LTLLRELQKIITAPVFETSIPVAEMLKYVSNAFRAVKVSFSNEVGTLCLRLGVDASLVTKI
jgi:UDPglucose 6-dehydrogenase